MENGRPLAGYRYNEDGTVRSLTLGSSLYTEADTGRTEPVYLLSEQPDPLP